MSDEETGVHAQKDKEYVKIIIHTMIFFIFASFKIEDRGRSCVVIPLLSLVLCHAACLSTQYHLPELHLVFAS